jgi:hypothetical protein
MTDILRVERAMTGNDSDVEKKSFTIRKEGEV